MLEIAKEVINKSRELRLTSKEVQPEEDFWKMRMALYVTFGIGIILGTQIASSQGTAIEVFLSQTVGSLIIASSGLAFSIVLLDRLLPDKEREEELNRLTRVREECQKAKEKYLSVVLEEKIQPTGPCTIINEIDATEIGSIDYIESTDEGNKIFRGKVNDSLRNDRKFEMIENENKDKTIVFYDEKQEFEK